MTEPRVITLPLGGSPLAQLAQGEAAPAWYAISPRGINEWRARGIAAARRGGAGTWLRALGAALPADGVARARLDRAVAGGFVVTTGQQPGLFGGPIYTWSKALSALALADELERACGLPVAPVFWAATDDSDFTEAATTHVAIDSGVRTVALTGRTEPDAPLRDVPLGDVAELIRTLRAATGAAVAPHVLDLAADVYRPEATVGEAYVSLLRRLLGPLGIAVLDGGHPVVADAARTTLELALERAEQVDASLVARDEMLRAAGHEPQVARVSGLSLVFTRRDGLRRRLPIAEARRGLDPELHPVLSANVLLRPVVEHELVPTVAYVAGPGELAYFAQVGAVAEAMSLSTPVAAPRWSGVIVEPHVQRILRRYGLDLMDLRATGEVETRLARRALSVGVADALAALHAAVTTSLRELGEALSAAEGGAPEAVLRGAERDLLRRTGRLERRLLAAAKRRDEQLTHDLATARAALFPFGRPQERVLNLLPMLARHGEPLFDLMLLRAREHARRLVGQRDGVGPLPEPSPDDGRLSRAPGGA